MAMTTYAQNSHNLLTRQLQAGCTSKWAVLAIKDEVVVYDLEVLKGHQIRGE